MVTTGIPKLSRFLLVLSGGLLVASVFLPIWRIELDAPQYPEGLVLLIYADKLGGDVEIINGLNHYIGMGTLHAENFIEFTVLPYIVGFFALWALTASATGNTKVLYALFISFVLFGIFAMVDFWRWEYNYGHNLDPNAAIIVPGMSYQPPLIGFKQLLNFGAFSVPDIGGWLYIGSGVIMAYVTIFHFRTRPGKTLTKTFVASSGILFFCLTSCGSADPDPIVLNSDKCEFCKMTISDARFGAELITSKGRIYKFDDLSCMISYARENSGIDSHRAYVNDYGEEGILIEAEKAFFILSDSLHSPMRGNTAAFADERRASELAEKLQSRVVGWSLVKK